MKYMIVKNEFQATHWKHVDSFKKCSLKGGGAYPIRTTIQNEDTYYEVVNGTDRISVEWIKSNCRGYFVREDSK